MRIRLRKFEDCGQFHKETVCEVDTGEFYYGEEHFMLMSGVINATHDYSFEPLPPEPMQVESVETRPRATLVVVEKHRLPIAEVIMRMRKFSPQLQAEYAELIAKIEERWEGDTLHYEVTGVKGRVFKGTVVVGLDNVRVTAEIPFLFWAWSGEVKRRIERTLLKLLA